MSQCQEKNNIFSSIRLESTSMGEEEARHYM